MASNHEQELYETNVTINDIPEVAFREILKYIDDETIWFTLRNVCMKISSRKSFLFGQLFESLGKVIIFLNFLLFQRIFKKSRKLFLRSYQRKFQIIIELIDEILKI